MNIFKSILVLLSVAICFLNTIAMAQPTEGQSKAFRSAQNIRITIDQSYPAKDIELPFHAIAEGLLKYAELPIIESDIEKYTLIIQIVAKGEAKPLSYRVRTTDTIVDLYAKAILTGTISLKMNDVYTYQEEFWEATATKLNVDHESFKNPSDAPFDDLLKHTALGNHPRSCFSQKMFLLIGRIFGARVLIDALNNSNEEMFLRENAAMALGRLKDTMALDALIAALSNKNFFLREYAAESLGQIGDRRAVEPLIGILDDRWGAARSNAAGALKSLTGQDFGENHAKWQQWWEENKDEILKNS